ncbi:MAG TPA: hypothetical protein VKU00_13775 [Chthonomonadaceae bacterium]|nr:hypothetical protein [Chthonomonadaceae bacterium]
MEPQDDIIADISKDREKFFGCSGKMLIPSTATVEALLQEIPKNKLITVDLIRKELASRFEVQVTCPPATQKALQAIAKHSPNRVAYWRVLKKNGELMANFPGGLQAHANLLREEGFKIVTTGKAPKVENFTASLVQFG